MDSPTPGLSLEFANYDGLKVKEAHLLLLKCHPKGQASNLTDTTWSLLEYYPGTETGGHHLHALLLPYSGLPGKELVHLFVAWIVVTAT